MNFLSSIFFSLIPLISIPLIIHLLNKRNIITIDFSSIRFLKALESESIRRLQFLQILLMILRTLIILLIIFMMTRPVIGGLFSYWDSDDEALISAIIIDDSFSMNGKSNDHERYDLVISTFKNVLENISDNSQVYIATLSKGELYNGIKAKLPESENLFQLTYTSSEIGGILKDMESQFSEQDAIKELYYITDGQQSHIKSAAPFKPFLSDWKIFTLIIPPVKDNLSILTVDIADAILLPNSPLTINVSILNNGGMDVENRLIQLFVNEISVAQQLVTLKKNSESNFEFITAIPQTGDYACHLKLDDDDRTEDNNFYFKISIPEKLKIGIIASDNETVYMSHLIESINFKNTVISNTKYSPNNIQRAIGDGNDVLIQNGYHLLSATGIELIEYVGKGGHLIIFPDDTDTSTSELDIFESQYFNSYKKELTNENFQIASAIKANSQKELSSITYTKNPIKLFQYFKLEQNDNSILVTDDGFSVYSRHYEGNGLIDIFSMAPTLIWSNFPIRGYFIPFFHQLFYNQFNSTNNLYFNIDDKWEISLQAKEGHDNLKYESPTAQNYHINMNSLHVDYQRIPGIHKLNTLDKIEITFIAMNPREIESNDKYINEIDLKQYLSENASIILISESNLKETIQSSRVGSELWKLILYLITLLLIIEMIISSNAVKKTSS